jgi:hypothetical protein
MLLLAYLPLRISMINAYRDDQKCPKNHCVRIICHGWTTYIRTFTPSCDKILGSPPFQLSILFCSVLTIDNGWTNYPIVKVKNSSMVIYFKVVDKENLNESSVMPYLPMYPLSQCVNPFSPKTIKMDFK